VGGQYAQETRTLPDGRELPVFVLVSPTESQRFLLTNPNGYSMRYDGLVAALDKRWSGGLQAFGSYSFSRVSGLMASSGTTAAGPQASTVAAPSMPFGRDPNDLTNARGRLPNDRPHVFRAAGTGTLPRTGVAIAATLQHFSGKPWAASTQVLLPQGDQRILLESRGSRRLSSQTLVDLRVSKALRLGGATRLELLVDVLNLLNDTAEEGLASEDLYSPTFAEPALFMDPRRAMIGVRLNVGP
jgi:hypothetical protein